MTDQELIELLRNEDGERQYIREAKIVLQAERSLSAVRIEELVKETELLTKEVKLLEIGFDAARAKLTKAVEALREIKAGIVTYSISIGEIEYDIRRTLAELEGEKIA